MPYPASGIILLSTTDPAPLGAPMRVVATCPSAVAVIFTGSLLQSTGVNHTIDLYLQFVNVLTPLVPQRSTVPVTVTLEPNVYTSVAIALDTVLAAGTYEFDVVLVGTEDIDYGLELVASGTLNATVSRAGGPTYGGPPFP
jgi:hypothetical protein